MQMLLISVKRYTCKTNNASASGNTLPDQIHDISCIIMGRKSKRIFRKHKIAFKVSPDPVGNHSGFYFVHDSVPADFIGAAIGQE